MSLGQMRSSSQVELHLRLSVLPPDRPRRVTYASTNELKAIEIPAAAPSRSGAPKEPSTRGRAKRDSGSGTPRRAQEEAGRTGSGLCEHPQAQVPRRSLRPVRLNSRLI